MDTNAFFKIEDALTAAQRERDKFLGKKETLDEQLKKLGYSNLSVAEKALNKIEIEIETEDFILKEKFETFKSTFETLLS